MSIKDLISGLNPQQKEAVTYNEGPLLVLAGAGSGKTRVITYKYAYLCKKEKLTPKKILTVTFTNKAAREMKDRIVSLTGRSSLDGHWIGTFHSQCLRILKKECKALGYKPDFVIYDEDDACSLVRHILKEMNLYEALFKGVYGRISALKASLIDPEEFMGKGNGFDFDEKLARIYVRYQDELKRSNAMDFDDLIMLTVKLFKDYPEILEKYQKAFEFILVDEFQDTNTAQYELIKLLADAHKRVSVVGDDDQSIYRFRGAEVTNVYKFEEEFPETRVVKLEQNYRSCQNILEVSWAVISKNPNRKEKKLYSERGEGEKVYFYWLSSEEEEANYVASKIREIYLKGKYGYNDIAILYRINLQSKALEEALRRERIPYKVVGATAFYERREIKDLIAYLRLIHNPHDNVSLRRVINVPSRGIGAATLQKIEKISTKKGLSLYGALKQIVSDKSTAKSVKEKLQEFLGLIEELRKIRDRSVSEILKEIDLRTGYSEGLPEERIENIAQLMATTEGRSLGEFLEEMAIMSRQEDSPEEGKVSLMTMHMAKGLEFPVVFVVGLEEGLMPYFKATDSPEALCEERRLFYVAMTRAKDLLVLSGARKRRVFSKLQEQKPSRFLVDVPKDCCTWIEKSPCVMVSKDGNGVNRKAVRKDVLPDKPNQTVPFKTGCRVRHPKWGIGVVRDCYGEGDDIKVCVNFPKFGLKKLALKYVQLERV